MPTAATATILPFPRLRHTVTPTERLTAALADLAEAVAEHHAVLRHWRPQAATPVIRSAGASPPA